MNEFFNVIARISTPGGQTSEGKSMKFGVALMALVVIMGVIELALGRNPVTAFATIFCGSGGAVWLIRVFSVTRSLLKTGLSDMLQNPEFAQLMRDFLSATDTANAAAVSSARNVTEEPAETPQVVCDYAAVVTFPSGETRTFPLPTRIEACQRVADLKIDPEYKDKNCKFHVK